MHSIKKIPFACSECSIRQVQVSCILENNFGNWKFWDNKKQWPLGRNKLKNRGLFRKLCRQSNCNPEFLNYLVFSRENIDQHRCLCELMEPFSRSMPMPSTQEHCFHVANRYGYTNSDWFSQYIYSNLYRNRAHVQRSKVLKKKHSDEMRNLCELYNSTVGRSRDDELEQLVRELKQKYIEFEYKNQLKKAQTIEDDDDDRFKPNTKNLNKKQVKRKKKQLRINLKPKKLTKNLDSKGTNTNTNTLTGTNNVDESKPNAKTSASVSMMTPTLIQPIGDNITGKNNQYLSRGEHKLNKRYSASVPGIATTLVQAAGDNIRGNDSQYLSRSKRSFQEKSHGDGKPQQIPIDNQNKENSKVREISKEASIETYNSSKHQMIPGQISEISQQTYNSSKHQMIPRQKSGISQQTAISNDISESFIKEDPSLISYVPNRWRRLTIQMQRLNPNCRRSTLSQIQNIQNSRQMRQSQKSGISQQTALSTDISESYVTEDPSLISYVSNKWQGPSQRMQHNNSNLSSTNTQRGSTRSEKENEQKRHSGRSLHFCPHAQSKLIKISPVSSKTKQLDNVSLTEEEKIDYTLRYFNNADEAPIRHSTYVPNIPSTHTVPFKIHRSDVRSLSVQRNASRSVQARV